MRRLICILLTFFLVMICGCDSQTEDTFKKPSCFYYPRNEVLLTSSTGVIEYEERETANITGNKQLLEYYLEGPQSSSLFLPTPEEGSVVDCAYSSSTLYITLSHHFDDLSGIDYTLAMSCIAMTMLSATNFKTVEIDIINPDGSIIRHSTIVRDQVLLADTHIALPAE